MKLYRLYRSQNENTFFGSREDLANTENSPDMENTKIAPPEIRSPTAKGKQKIENKESAIIQKIRAWWLVLYFKISSIRCIGKYIDPVWKLGDLSVI